MRIDKTSHRVGFTRRSFLKKVAGAAVLLGPIASGRVFSRSNTKGGVAIEMSEVTAFIEGHVQSGDMLGALLVAARDGKVFYEQYFGTRCDGVRRDAVLDGDTVHILASFSKVITATVV
ncbi:MAG: beta-lactamase family protein, partial [Candidatus Hydrogenedentes bacterium]|nr:beta-lactamase family protein [Candidatus Hydrogenedentota bacterium]